MTSEKYLAKEEKEEKDIYLQEFLDRRRHFTPLVFSANIIIVKEARTVTSEMASHLSFKLNRGFS